MGTTADKLNKLVENKSAIKTAIKTKRGGADIGDNMSTWANEINNIEPLLDTLNISENGEYDVKEYKNVDVNVLSEMEEIVKNYIERTSNTFKIPYGVTKIATGAFTKESQSLNTNAVQFLYLYIPNTVKEFQHLIFSKYDSKNSNYIPLTIYFDGTFEDWIKIPKGFYDYKSGSNFYSINAISSQEGNHHSVFFKNKDGEYEDLKQDIDLSNITELPIGALSSFNGTKNLPYWEYYYQLITIPKTLTNLGVACFYEFYCVSTIEFEDGSEFEELPAYIFARTDRFDKSSSKPNIILPKIKSIGEFAFSSSKLYTIEFKEGLEEIKLNAFKECSNITNLNFPQSLKIIGNYCFNSCSSLSEIVLPESITSIGDRAFYSNSKLKLITMKSTTPPTIQYYSFPRNSGMKIYVPHGTSSVYKSATNWSYLASYIYENYSVSVVFPPQLVNNETVTYSIDGGATYQQFTSEALTLNEVATIKIKSTDSTQTILIGTTSGGNDLGTISNSEITLSFTTDTTVYLTLQ